MKSRASREWPADLSCLRSRFAGHLHQSRIAWGVFIVGSLYGYFFSQGIPLWDDDFASIFDKIQNKTVWQIFLEWVSPISTQPQFWGFNERPVQALIYKIFYFFVGYDSGLYFLYKNLIFGALGWMIYRWSRRLLGEASSLWALLPTALFLLCPGPMAAHFLHSDLATTSQFLFLFLTYHIWDAVETTPTVWQGLTTSRECRQWMLRWGGLTLATYLGYKSKADLKLIPAILGLYLLTIPERRKQWRIFIFPLAGMFLLAVPWGPGIFKQLPPFLPGSHGSEIGWMWQPVTTKKLTDFIWSDFPWDVAFIFKTPTISLAAILGPFVLIPAVIFAIWYAVRSYLRDQNLAESSWPTKRARNFVALWFVVMIFAVGSLPVLNLTFRIRYGILPLVPAILLLAWLLGQVARNLKFFPSMTVAAIVACFALQGAIDFYRSVEQRSDLGSVMNAVDRAYEFINDQLPNAKLVSVEGYRSYFYHTDASPVIRERELLDHFESLTTGKYPVGNTYALSWVPTFWDQVEYVAKFSGCRGGVAFNIIADCDNQLQSYLFRYIGRDPEFALGEQLRQTGNFAEALKAHEHFLQRYPRSFAAYFSIGIEAMSVGNNDRAEEAWSYLEYYFPHHATVLYNHGLTLKKRGDAVGAASRFSQVLKIDPTHFGPLVNSFSRGLANDSKN